MRTVLYGGLTFGPQGTVDANGVTWLLHKMDGWGATASSVQDVANVRRRGGWSGDGYATARHMTVTLTLIAPTPGALSVALDSLHQAVSLTPSTFTVTDAAGTRWLMVKRDSTVVDDGLVSSTFAQPTFQVFADDGRKLGTALTGQTDVASTTGGLTVPFTIPFSIPAVTSSGVIGLNNPGNTDGPLTLLIHGPLTGPSVAHVSSGLTLTFAESLTLGAEEWLLVDMDAQSALAQGQATRAQFITSRQWFHFDPGDNEFQFTASSASPGCFLQVSATPAWQ